MTPTTGAARVDDTARRGREPLNTKRCWRCGVLSMKTATRCQDCGAKL